ncbi:MAG: sialate O-acetylesterase [Planctomycetaceae bacterium]|nr:sialate O-acetylesterase [Planctomycetaceae bacterium]
MKRTILALVTLALIGGNFANADVKLSRVFGNHMVLQQERPIRVFGWADPGEKVSVELAGNSAEGTAGDDGRFRVELPHMKADGKSHTLTVKGSNTIKLEDVLLGEVWICSGQSNMEWSVAISKNAQEEIAAAKHPNIRLFNVPGHVAGPVPLTDARGQWQVCSPQSVPGFSAVGYYFGRALQQKLNVPIGLVGTNWGGTRIEPWTPPVGFQQVESLKDYRQSLDATDIQSEKGKQTRQRYLDQLDKWLDVARQNLEAGKPIGQPPRANFTPKGGATQIYNGMVHALIPLSARGVIWYQGESNAGDGVRYEFLKEALVKGWRTVFENDDLSFYWVQLANFTAPNENPAGGGWGHVREGQRRALRIPNTGMAVIIDIGEARDIHPRNKQDVGARLALWALAENYGHDIVYSGPLYKGMKVEGNKIRISFDHVGGGLMMGKKEGLEPTKEDARAELTQFAIQADDGQWHWAQAKIDGDTVVVWAEGVEKPKNVHFGYQSNPVGINLYNKEGLPASPFRTE